MARIDQSDDWRERHAPTISTFESLTLEAYGHLPEEFRLLATDLIIDIKDFPDDDVFEDMALETPFDLLGLFEGRGIGERLPWKPARCRTGSRSTAGPSSITGPKTMKRWATSSPMC